MNTLAWKRRWYLARPWVKDVGALLILLTACAAGFWAMDFAAFICRVKGWCA